MNTAQVIYAALIGIDREFFSRETANVAVEQTREIVMQDRAPHANRPTPPRPHFPRAKRNRPLFRV